MSGLDCNTETGQVFIAYQTEAEAILSAHWECAAFFTRRECAAAVDALFACKGELRHIVEIKARNLTLAELSAHGSYIITFDKLIKGRALAQHLATPFHVAVFLIPDRRLVLWDIADSRGEFTCGFTIERTLTKANCNGGTATRANAYLPLGNMIKI